MMLIIILLVYRGLFCAVDGRDAVSDCYRQRQGFALLVLKFLRSHHSSSLNHLEYILYPRGSYYCYCHLLAERRCLRRSDKIDYLASSTSTMPSSSWGGRVLMALVRLLTARTGSFSVRLAVYRFLIGLSFSKMSPQHNFLILFVFSVHLTWF